MKSLQVAAIMWSLSCGLAFAQDEPARKPLPTPSPSVVLGRELRSGTKVTVVTIAQPTTRQACRVLAFEGEKLTCQASKGHPAITYNESELVAIIKADDPGSRFSFKRFLESFGLGGGALAGAVFLASTSMVAAVPLAVISTVLVIGGLFDLMESTSRDHTERALYLNSDQQLQVVLK